MALKRAFFDAVLPASWNLKSVFKIVNAENADDMYSKLSQEQARIFHYLDLRRIVSKANSPAGISVVELDRLTGGGENNPLMELIQQPALFSIHPNQYVNSCRTLKLIFQHDRIAQLAKNMYADLLTSSTAESLFLVNTPIVYESEGVSVQRKDIIDMLIEAVIATNAVTTCKVMVKRQMELVKDPAIICFCFRDMMINSNHPDLFNVFIDAGVDPNSEVTVVNDNVSLLTAIICDYNTFLMEMVSSREAAENDKVLTDRMLSAIDECMVEKAHRTERVLACLQANKVDFVNLSKVAQESLNKAFEVIAKYKSIREECMSPYSLLSRAREQQLTKSQRK